MTNDDAMLLFGALCGAAGVWMVVANIAARAFPRRSKR